MGHYDNCRDGYCPKCGAAPGNMRSDGSCEFCHPDPKTGAESQHDASLSALALTWKDAYLAFTGAFDTPVARRKDDSVFASDARRRLRDFHEQFSTFYKEHSK